MIKIYENAGMNINAEISEDRVNFKAKGVLGPVVNPVVNLMMKYFREERPLVLSDDQLIFSSWIPPMPSKAFERLVNNQIKMAVTRTHIPEEVSVAVTGKCPCDCMFCCAKGIVAEPELTLDEMKDLIDQAIDAGAYLLVFDGGETLLRKDIYDIIEYVDDRAIAVMFTNGLYLTEEVAKKLKDAGLYSLQVSIDSPYQEDHDRVRGIPGIFKNATSGARAAVEAGLLVSLYYVARPENSDDKTLNDLVKLAEDVGAHEVSIYDILAIGKW
ncbi:MAG: radical SAM protein, partial [Halobacteriota archaeon]|nr:radical SAM protein [Halobacteriota archaeon]